MYNFTIFRFMMFSECLEHGKYDFQYLQATVRAKKLLNFEFWSCSQSETVAPLSGAKNISPKLQKLRQTLTVRDFRILIRLS